MKSFTIAIGVGLLNFIHGVSHLIQFIQSMILLHESTSQEHQGIFHTPIFALIWAIVGLTSLVIGIRDYKHHRKCKTV